MQRLVLCGVLGLCGAGALLLARAWNAEVHSGLRDLGDAAAPIESGPDSGSVDRRAAGDVRVERPATNDLIVRCRDASGGPISGLDVVLRPLGSPSRWHDEIPATSDGAGMLCFANARSKMKDGPFVHRVALEATNVLPGLEPLLLDSERDFERVVEWQLPEIVSLEVRLLDLRDRPIADGTTVMLEETDEELVADLPSPSIFSRMTESIGGVARFARVRAGIPCTLELGSSPYPYCTWSLPPLVPSAAPQRHEVRMRDGARCLYGTIEDAGGKPLRGQKLALRWQGFDGTVDERSIESTEAGEFVIQPPRGSSPARFLLRHEDLCESAWFELGADLGDGALDVGVVKLSRDDEIVSGTVLGADGARRAGANVVLEAIVAEGDPSCDPLQSPRRSTFESDSNGCFRCFGPRLPLGARARYRVRAALNDETSPFVVVDCGARDVVLALTADGIFNAHVVLPPEVDAHLVGARLVSTEGEECALSWMPTESDAAYLASRQLPAGTYRFELELRQLPDWVFALESVVIPSGDACADPRMQRIDLRPKLRVVSFVLQRERTEEELEAATLIAASLDGQSPAVRSVPVIGKDVLHAILPAGSYSGRLIADGARAVHLEILEAHQTVQLHAGIPVVLVVDHRSWRNLWLGHRPALRLLHEGISAACGGGALERQENDGAVEARFFLPAAGVYELHWNSDFIGCGMYRPEPERGDPLQIEVRESAGEQRFAVRPPAR